MIEYDPKAYRERSVPRAIETARAAMEAFCTDVQALAQKHGVADVTMSALANVTLPSRDLVDDKPEETAIQLVVHFGDRARAVECAAYAHAYLRAEEDAWRLRIKAQAEKAASKRAGT